MAGKSLRLRPLSQFASVEEIRDTPLQLPGGGSVPLKEVAGTLDVRHDLGPGAPTLGFRVDDAVAARHGISRIDVARAIYGRTRGLSVGELYSGEDPIPVVIRSAGLYGADPSRRAGALSPLDGP